MNKFFNSFIQSHQTLAITADQQHISFAAFWQDVSQQAQLISLNPESIWALWQQDSYEFLVLLFAALQAKKRILLPPHRVAQLEQNLAAQNIYFLSRQTSAEVTPSFALDFSDQFIDQAQIVFYTSGSTGEPKHIQRTLLQLFNEVKGLNQTFSLPEAVIALATVSHQHIYGLLFKVLWPLLTGRSFYSPQLAFPEDVIGLQRHFAEQGLVNYVISSPALLKRWTLDLELVNSLAVFSSGGKLEKGVRPLLNQSITEIFGSSETGGIAYRTEDESAWQAFADVKVEIQQQSLKVQTEHAFSTDWIETGDLAEWHDVTDLASGFKLLGRADRLIKLEEKRLSLDAIEQTIQTLAEIKQCHALLIEQEQRQFLACIVVLHDAAHQHLQQIGKQAFVSGLKQQLNGQLENIATPRLWRFLTELPQNSQSKLDKQYLKSLFQPMLEPVILSRSQVDECRQMKLEFTPELLCFKGHFPNQPIYPGVGQIGFIQTFAKHIWADLDWCNGYEQLKFQHLIRPYHVIELKLTRKQHKVSFQLSDAEQTLASGRLLFVLKDLDRETI
ncbi:MULTISPECIES: AMP-binding protein [unclassified Acinetobacter]|uniref:AMP-binding protein n=1 Tax=unclassified Acinetobacter TaxID=196816 RepID=UPI00190A4589|nr:MULTISPECIES: AMP-binding protein [unclassified Acinetobacter]MBK0064614.1 AMP-binding protein [Acinetobacter sp. S55]MBK0067997.1 AMP-binding protein [Acinetobacter sp. S54]